MGIGVRPFGEQRSLVEESRRREVDVLMGRGGGGGGGAAVGLTTEVPRFQTYQTPSGIKEG